MAKGLLFGFIVWIAVSFGFYVFGHLTRNEKRSVVMSAIYGLITAVLAVGIVVGITVAF